MASILIPVLQKYPTVLNDMQKINMEQMLNKMKQIGGNNPKLKEADRKGKSLVRIKRKNEIFQTNHTLQESLDSAIGSLFRLFIRLI